VTHDRQHYAENCRVVDTLEQAAAFHLQFNLPNPVVTELPSLAEQTLDDVLAKVWEDLIGLLHSLSGERFGLVDIGNSDLLELLLRWLTTVG
jgi:hypothetical protein